MTANYEWMKLYEAAVSKQIPTYCLAASKMQKTRNRTTCSPEVQSMKPRDVRLPKR